MTHTFTPNALLTATAQDFIERLRAVPSGLAGVVAGIPCDYQLQHEDITRRPKTRIIFGRITMHFANTTLGRRGLNSILNAYNAYEPHGEPHAFLAQRGDSATSLLDTLPLYEGVEPAENAMLQQMSLGFFLSANPLDLSTYQYATQEAEPILTNAYIPSVHGRVLQQEQPDGSLMLSFPLLTSETDVAPMLSIISHISDTNAGDDLLSIEWSARDTSHEAYAEYACYTRGIYLKDASGWHVDRIDTAHETLNDY